MMLSTGRIEEKKGGGDGLGSGIFLEESRYHLNQVASTPYCTCHPWQRWHRFFLWPKNLHYPLLESLQTMKAFYNPPVSIFVYGIFFIENLSSSFSFSSFLLFAELASIMEVMRTSLLFSERVYSKARTIVNFEFFFFWKISQRY